MSNFNVSQTHPLIPNNQNYRLDRKLISVHSEDRDLQAWPSPNHFEITLPVDLRNVVSLRLVDVQLPANYYVFSHNYQNTKFTFTINSPLGGTIITRGAGTKARLLLGNP